MKTILSSFLLLFIASSLMAYQPSIKPESVAVIYNSDEPKSKELAEYYASQRSIPQQNLIGLPLSKQGKISREAYQKNIEAPLRKHFTRKRWWKLAKTSDGFIIPVEKKIQLLVTVKGVPFGVNRTKPSPLPEGQKAPQFHARNEASVDNELAMLGIHGLTLGGPANNQYYKRNLPFADAKLPHYFLTGRIDGPSWETCKRLIDDAIATEKTGLWGMCYLDFAQKGKHHSLGDEWLTAINLTNWIKGIPTTVDANKQTYVTNYPMRDVAIYYGWYTTHKNGPLLNPRFKFRKGSIAVHLHSYSAGQLRNPTQHWVGPLLEKGAAATVGNVYEPYLQISHNFEILHDRLLSGYTLAEASAMSVPALSWQTVCIGDPLYQPFKHLTFNTGEKAESDKIYRLIHVAWQRWRTSPDILIQKLRTVAAEKKEGRIYEALGLWMRHQKKYQDAASYFLSADQHYKETKDNIRIKLHLADMHRENKQKNKALTLLRQTLKSNPSRPEAKSLKALINILDPPPPPPVDEKKVK